MRVVSRIISFMLFTVLLSLMFFFEEFLITIHVDDTLDRLPNPPTALNPNYWGSRTQPLLSVGAADVP